MANYKPLRQSITVGNVTTEVPLNATVKYLYEFTAGSTVADSMFHEGTVYTVTTGKTFRLLGIAVSCNNSGTSGLILTYSGDTENATTSSQVSIPITSSTVKNPFETALDIEWVAGKYVVYAPTVVRVEYVTMVGYEY